MSDSTTSEFPNRVPDPRHRWLQVIRAAAGTTVFATAHGDMHIWDGSLAHAFIPYAPQDGPVPLRRQTEAADPLLAELTAWRKAPAPDETTAPVPYVAFLSTTTDADLEALAAFLYQSQAAGWAVWTALPRRPDSPSGIASIPAVGTGRALVWVPAAPSWAVSDLVQLATDPVLRISRQNRVLLHAHSPGTSTDPDPGMTWWPALRSRFRKAGATDIRTLRR